MELITPEGGCYHASQEWGCRPWQSGVFGESIETVGGLIKIRKAKLQGILKQVPL
jgi:hypothetical protein